MLGKEKPLTIRRMHQIPTHQQLQLYCTIQLALKHQEKPWHFVRVSSNRQNAQPKKSSIEKEKKQK
jgi:hypothetical protein